ncbi:MAG TPA: 2-phosphosulfolactate phosphatase [Anaerolineales bacterium]|jgi:2-phosphosulfolactate phosphatase
MRFNYITLENCASARGTVVAIDVLRAFTTAAYAFESGAESISLVAGVEEALIMKARHPGWLVMGEEGGLPPVGFDFGNSPTQIAKQDLTGKQIIQRTGAGTQGVVRSVKATQLLAASFVVASATVRYVLDRRPRVVTFVITGGEQNEEDLSCAEYLECLFRGWSPDPAPFIKRVFDSKDALFHLDPARSEFPYYDLEYCTHIDAFPFAMPVSRENERLVLRPVIPAA